jgi:pimeloyl-ACP methyl ester carboxylesterase
MILTANGAMFDVIQTGTGRDLVLLHSLLTDCAHCPPLEKPAEFLAAVQAFLDAP